MTCINVREGEARAIFYALDECGVPLAGATNKLVIDTVAEISYEDTITEGDEVTERNFGGKKKYSATGRDEITNIAVNLSLLGINPAVDAMLMGGDTLLDGADVAGFGRKDLGSAAVACEVQVKLDADACAAGTTATPVAAWFFPFVKNWKPNGGVTLNGTDLVKPPFSGKGFMASPDIFSVSGDTDFDKWDGVYEPPVDTQNSDGAGHWFAFYLFDGATYTQPTADCEPVAFSVS